MRGHGSSFSRRVTTPGQSPQMCSSPCRPPTTSSWQKNFASFDGGLRKAYGGPRAAEASIVSFYGSDEVALHRPEAAAHDLGPTVELRSTGSPSSTARWPRRPQARWPSSSWSSPTTTACAEPGSAIARLGGAGLPSDDANQNRFHRGARSQPPRYRRTRSCDPLAMGGTSAASKCSVSLTPAGSVSNESSALRCSLIYRHRLWSRYTAP